MTKNDKKIHTLIKENGGVISRHKALESGISSSSFGRFANKGYIYKVAPGIYALHDSIQDPLQVIQKRFPKVIFSGMTALYLNHLTDRIPDYIEFTMPKGYRIRKESMKENMMAHIENNEHFFVKGNIEIEDEFGNAVLCYGPEKTVVEMLRKKDLYDKEIYIKAIRKYLSFIKNDITPILDFANMRNIQDKARDVLELLANDDQ